MSAAGVVRNMGILQMRKAGETLQATADHYGISRERVRQIARQHRYKSGNARPEIQGHFLGLEYQRWIESARRHGDRGLWYDGSLPEWQGDKLWFTKPYHRKRLRKSWLSRYANLR